MLDLIFKMPVERWNCNPLLIPMELKHEPYLGFDHTIRWTRVYKPKIVYNLDSFITAYIKENKIK